MARLVDRALWAPGEPQSQEPQFWGRRYSKAHWFFLGVKSSIKRRIMVARYGEREWDEMCAMRRLELQNWMAEHVRPWDQAVFAEINAKINAEINKELGVKGD